MADWYCSSAAYALIPAFQASHAYSIGDFVVPTAPALLNKWVFRVTTAGTSSTEPSWPVANAATVTSGGATFTNVTGQSTYFWAAAAGDLPTILGGGSGASRAAAGDRIFVSSDHSETQTATSNYGSGNYAFYTPSYSLLQILCVNRGGSTPPVAADLTTGATVIQNSTSNSMIFWARSPVYHYGISYSNIGSGGSLLFANGAATVFKSHYFKNCSLNINNSGSAAIFQIFDEKVILDNTPILFGNASQTIYMQYSELQWINTPSAIAGTAPSALFNASAGVSYAQNVTLRGVDLSAVTSKLVQNNGTLGNRVLLDSCKINSGVARYTNTSGIDTQSVVDLVNCFDGTNILSETHTNAGDVTTEFTITLSGGATDNVGTFSHKLVSGTNIDKLVNPLEGFWMDANYTTTGSAKTATVEIISSSTLNNDDIWLVLEYQGTSSSSVTSFSTSQPSNVLTTASAITSSSATWNSSPSTPQKQKLTVSFTPRTAGRVRGQVRLGKPSATVYVDPRITIS